MRRSAEAEGVEAFARALQGTFPARDDAPLALALLRLLSEGRLDDRSGAGPSSGPHGRGGRRALERLAHVERDQAGHIVAFSGLTLRPTAHEFMVGTRRLHTWCVWDTLFLPALLGETAEVRSSCPVTGSVVELVVAPDGVTSARPSDMRVSFPPLAATDTADITGSFSCHVFFFAGADAARSWRETRGDDLGLEVDAAFELGRRAVSAPLEPGSSTVMEVSRDGREHRPGWTQAPAGRERAAR